MDKHTATSHLKADGADLTNKRHLSLNPNKKPAGHHRKLSAGFDGSLLGGYHGK